MLVVWLLFCCASVAPGNFPPALSRRGHCRATFQLAFPGVCRSLFRHPARSIFEWAIRSGLLHPTVALSVRIRPVTPRPVYGAAGSARVVCCG
jgi:hypothetical protein